MKITEIRAILKSKGFGVRKAEGTKYSIRHNGETWFTFDLVLIRDAAHFNDYLSGELDRRRIEATSRWQ